MTAYRLFGNEMSFYTGKVRAYLDWKGLPYEEILPTREVFKTTLLPRVGRAIIPVLETPDGQFIQDSSDIIAALELRHPESTAMPGGPQQKLVTLLLELLADEWLIIHALHYRWAYNNDWAYLEFGKTSLPDASEQEQYAAGKKNARFFENWQPEVGASAATRAGVEQTYGAFLNMLSAHFADYDYIFGDRPSYADFALYGPLYAHLYRDPESGALMRQLAPRVCSWVERCQHGGQDPTRPRLQQQELLPDDTIPDTLKPILAWQMREQLPVLVDSDELMNTWAKNAAAGEPVPRGFGTTNITIGGSQGTCLARSFPLYRLQAVQDQYQNMTATERNRANELLNEVGGGRLRDFQLSQRLLRANNQLVIDS